MLRRKASPRASGKLRAGDVRVKRSPYPGVLMGPYGGVVEVLAADAAAGHGGSYNMVMVDEIGLLAERDRDLIAGLRSSLSATGGRFVSLSIWGTGPFVPEIVESSKHDPAAVVHLYQARKGAKVNDRAAWAAANPGLGTVKQVEHLETEARRVAVVPRDAAFFKSHELNLPGSAVAAGREPVVAEDAWAAALRAPGELPPREGPCFLGFGPGRHGEPVGGRRLLAAVGACRVLGGRGVGAVVRGPRARMTAWAICTCWPRSPASWRRTATAA